MSYIENQLKIFKNSDFTIDDIVDYLNSPSSILKKFDYDNKNNIEMFLGIVFNEMDLIDKYDYFINEIIEILYSSDNTYEQKFVTRNRVINFLFRYYNISIAKNIIKISNTDKND
jgi:hypothetical protein